MKRAGWVRGLAVAVCLGAAGGAGAAEAESAPGSCEREASSVRSDTARHFLVLAAARDVFYDRSGPSFVMLMKTDRATEETEMGALGIYADDKGRAVFGSVPWQAYDAFLREPEKRSRNVLLRLEINEPQFERMLSILESWDRRARENQLLYRDDVFMNNILLVKQVTEELNRCSETVNLYKLDWGVEDRISDDNARSQVPLLVFEELKRRNAALHVSDGGMPKGVLALAGSEPLSARAGSEEMGSGKKAVAAVPAAAHAHHEHHHHVKETAAETH
jgi:hypothetical protein